MTASQVGGTGRSKEIRVCRVIARLNVGGPAFHVTHLSAKLGAPFKTTLVAGLPGSDEADMTSFAEERGVPVHVVAALGRELHPLRDIKTVASLVGIFRRVKPHIVHTHTAKAGALGRLAATIAGVPVKIHTYHGHVLGGGYFSARRTEFYRNVEAQLARVSQRLIVLTEAQRREMSQDLGVAPCEAFRVIPLGLELEPFLSVDRSADRRALRDDLHLPHDAFVVASVGRLVPIKRHDVLFRALARLKAMEQEGPRTYVAVAGGGELDSPLRALASELGVSDRVCWLGWRDDLPRVMAAGDVLALTSDDEGTPVAVLEALASGLPVVATAVGGVPEIVENRSGAALFERGNHDELAECLDRMRQNRPVVSQHDREAVVAQFSVNRLVKDIAVLYQAELIRAGVVTSF